MAMASSSMAFTVYLTFLCSYILASCNVAFSSFRLQELISSPSLYIFGASMVDTGENSVAMPRSSNADFQPYGVDCFGNPAGRWSNGRILIDFISQSLGIGLVYPYLQSFGADFTYGVNFASSGSTAKNSTVSYVDKSGGLFCLMRQIEQFRDFQNHIKSLTRPHQKIQLTEHITKSVYFIETAHNDYLQVAFKTSDFDPLGTVVSVIAAIRDALQALYDSGARTFIVMSLTPLGCNPSTNSNPYATANRDEYGCKTDFLNLASMHNDHLVELLAELREQYPAGEWIYFDAFSIMLDGYRNPAKYGVKYPLVACCGAGGPYNYIQEVECGKPPMYINGTYFEFKRCEDPSLHIIWDSLHPVETFSHYIASGVLDGTHLIPTFDILQRFESVKTIKETNMAIVSGLPSNAIKTSNQFV